MITGTIDLEVKRSFAGIVSLTGVVTIQLDSNNLSGDTSFAIETSLDKNNWDAISVSGQDYQETLSANNTFVQSFRIAPSIYFRVLFNGSTTGNVAYIHTGTSEVNELQD